MGKKVDLFKHYTNQIYRFGRLDEIRLLKLLEISQFVIIGFFLGLLSGKIITNYISFKYVESNYITKEYPEKKGGNNNPLLYLHISCYCKHTFSI